MTETKATIVLLDGANDGATVRVYQCHKPWDALQSSSRVDVRYCDHCQRDVHRVVDVDGFERDVALGQCVMVAGLGPADAGRQLFVG